MYYVYEWYEINTNEIFYVGKGCGERYKCRKRNNKFNEYVKNHECDSRIIKYFDTEQEAFEYEYIRIEELKMAGQCSCNVMKGGRGGTAECWSDESREYYSEHNIMKEKEQRERMSKFNPMKNKEIAIRTNSKKRKAVVIGDKEYESVKEAMLAYGICWDVFNNWCIKGTNPFGEKCKYKDEPQVESKDEQFNNKKCNSIIYGGTKYNSKTDLAKEKGVSPGTVSKWLRRGFGPHGVPCAFDNSVTCSINKRVKPVIINGIEYKSCYAASKILNIPSSTLYSYLHGARTSTEYICEYGNQQPSQGNVN